MHLVQRLLARTIFVVLAFAHGAPALAQSVTWITGPGSFNLSGPDQTFQWAATGASLYQLWIGSTPGAYDIGYYPPAGTTGTSVDVTGLPTDGRYLYLTMWSAIGGAYYSTASTFRAAVSGPAVITNPVNGATLSGSTQTFGWTNAVGATLYQLWVGSTPGAFDIGSFPAGGTTNTSLTVSGLPTDGRTLYATLWSSIGGVYQSSASTYTASGGSPPPTASVLTSPTDGSTLTGSSQIFQWIGGAGATYYQLWIGSTPGGYDIGYFPAGGTTSSPVFVSGLPTDGRTLYATLWSLVGGVYQSSAATYTAAGGSAPPMPAALTSPTNGSTLPGPSVLFQWNAAPGAKLYQLWVGNSPGAYDVGYFPAAGTMATSVAVNGLPNDGRTLYVRLWTAFDSGYQFNDYTFTAASAAPPPSAAITWPANGASLSGATETLRWSANPDAYGYQVWVGSAPGDFDIGYFPTGLTTDTQVDMTGLPTDGRPIYVTLWSALMTDGYASTTAAYYAHSPQDAFLPAPSGTGWALPGPAQAFDVPSILWTLQICDTLDGAGCGGGTVGGGQVTFSGLPVDGRALYARLKWTVNGQQRFRDYPMTAAPAGPAAVMLSPPNDWGLYSVGTSFSFTFSDVRASAYKIWAGSSPGGQEYGEFPSASGTTATTITVTVPAGTVPTRIRLWSLVGGVWYYRDYAYEWFSA